MLVLNESFFEIKEILMIGDNYCFVCSPLRLIEFNSNLNSVEISGFEDVTFKLIDVKKPLLKPHEKKMVGSKAYIFADTLDVYNQFTL